MLKGIQMKQENVIKRPSNWLSITEAAEYLRVSTRTIRRAISAGTLKYHRPTSKYLFRKRDLDAWVYGFGKKLSPAQRATLRLDE